MINSVTSMSNKRPLTREELRMAARIKAAIAAIPGMTEDRVGAELGVSQGAVSHWTGGRLPVPVRRAAPLAALLNIEDPGEISLAYRQAVRGAPPAVPSRSQPLRLDPVMLSETHRALRKLEHGEGRTFSLEKEEDAVRFAQLYEMRAAMSAHPTQDEWVEFGQKLAAIKTPTGGGNGRGDGVPTDGTSAKKVAR